MSVNGIFTRAEAAQMFLICWNNTICSPWWDAALLQAEAGDRTLLASIERRGIQEAADKFGISFAECDEILRSL